MLSFVSLMVVKVIRVGTLLTSLVIAVFGIYLHVSLLPGMQALFQGIHPIMLQYLHVRIRRTHVLQDALNQLMCRPDELKKPLKVTFISAGVDEDGLDEGGVTKEFFQLLIRQIFNEVTAVTRATGCCVAPSHQHSMTASVCLRVYILMCVGLSVSVSVVQHIGLKRLHMLSTRCGITSKPSPNS